MTRTLITIAIHADAQSFDVCRVLDAVSLKSRLVDFTTAGTTVLRDDSGDVRATVTAIEEVTE